MLQHHRHSHPSCVVNVITLTEFAPVFLSLPVCVSESRVYAGQGSCVGALLHDLEFQLSLSLMFGQTLTESLLAYVRPGILPRTHFCFPT